MGFNQFMLLDSAADYTVKRTRQTGGLGSIRFRELRLKMEYDGFEIVVLVLEFVWAPGGRSWHFALSYPSCVSLSRHFVREESLQREEVVEMCF